MDQIGALRTGGHQLQRNDTFVADALWARRRMECWQGCVIVVSQVFLPLSLRFELLLLVQHRWFGEKIIVLLCCCCGVNAKASDEIKI